LAGGGGGAFFTVVQVRFPFSLTAWFHDSGRDFFRHCAADVLAVLQRRLQQLTPHSALADV